jgi:hypothetical protein
VTEQELRALVRDAVLRHTGVQPASAAQQPPHVPSHPSHALLPLARGGDQDDACVIEPTVRCTHFGYCLSYGH